MQQTGMHLFNPKTLARYLTKVAPAPADHTERLSAWAEMITSGRVSAIKETALHADFKSNIVESILGYRGAVTGAEHSVTAEKTILRGSVDLALGHFTGEGGQIIAPFELKGAKTKDLDAIMPGRAKSPVQQAWEYATNAPGVKWVLVSNMVELRLYGFGEGTQAYEHFDLSKLNDPAEYARFTLLLGAENLLSGKTADLLKESRREDKDITDALYADYKSLRSTLISSVRQQRSDIDPLQAIAAAQTVLDRVLFTAFAEDTGLLPDRILEKAFEHADPFNPRPIWDNFKGLFTAINSGNKALNVPPYNGGLFAPDPIVDQLQIPDEVCEKFKDIGAYDFGSEVSVTVLGHIFEQSIADVERLQAEARGEVIEEKKKAGTSGRRKRDGVVYTPDYIARFIVEQTLGAHLKEIFAGIIEAFAKKGASADDVEIQWKRKGAELEAWEAYRERLQTLRIVDPACGSGVFLVMSFDYLKAELTRVNDKIATLRGEHRGDLFDPDSEILTNNLFGVDVNAESIEIAKLSLWVKTARRGKPLDSLDRNLKVGDSLIEDSNYAYLSHGFTWATAFPDILGKGGFDIVLGNPPYVRMELLKAMKPYLEKRFEVVSDRADLYCYFFERGLKLLKPGGRLGYISSSTFFKTGSGKPLRDFLRGQATLEAVVDFGDLQIFEGVTTYPAILTMRREVPDKKHDLRFWKLDALPDANFRASFVDKAETYPQNALTSGPWELDRPALKALRDKIRKDRKTLTELYGFPMRGVASGYNEAFVIDADKKEQLCIEDPRSSELLKPYLEGKDLKRWHAESRNLWLIYIPKNRVKIDEFPAIQNWLIRYKEKLEKRAAKQEWFELQQAQEAFMPHFSSSKILSTKISYQPTFCIDFVGSTISNTAYMVDAKEDNEFLISLLNSKLGNFFLKSMFVTKSGGFFEVQPEGLGMFPVESHHPEKKSQISELARLARVAAEKRSKLQSAFTRRIPDLAPAGTEPKLTAKLKEWWTLPDFVAFRAEVKKGLKADIPLAERSAWEDWIARDKAEIARLTAEIKANEDRINAIVYELFDLTPAEIKLLEASI